MNVYLIIPFVSFCIHLIAVVYGLVLKRRGRIYFAFVLVSLQFAGWSLTDLLLWLPAPESAIDPILRIQLPFYVFTGVTYLYLVYTYLHRNSDFVLKFFISFNAIALIFGLSTDLVIAEPVLMPWGYGFVPGPMHLPAATFGALLPYLLSMYLLINRIMTTGDQNEKTELAYYVTGIFLLTGIVFVLFIIMPEVFSSASQPLTHVFIALLQILNIYAIFRYQIFSIGIQSAANDLFSDATDGIIILGNDNRIVQANKPAENILASDFPDSLEVTVQTLLNEFKRKQVRHGELEVEVEHDNGDLSYISLTLSPVMHKQEQTGHLLQIRDVSEEKKIQQHILDMYTELKQARDEALGASQAKSRFLANMSHELRTPLNAIIGYSEMLKEQLEHENSTEHVTDVDRIHLAGNHLLSVINNILDLSKIEAGKVEINIDSFTVSGLTRMVAAMAEPSIRKNGNQFNLDCPDSVGDMRTDAMKLRQCLINVLSNAGRFTHNGKVELVIRRQPGEHGDVLVFAVHDTGIGIKPENLERIFQTFSQADDETTRLYGGSGLGLAISKRLVEMLGGDISVTSEPGQGSCFTITVPAVYQPPGTLE